MEREFEHRLTAVEDRSKSNTKRLDEMERRQDSLEKLTEAVAVVKTKQEHMDESMNEIKGKIQAILDKPGKRWETIVAAVITGIVGYLLAQLGVK